MLECEDAEMGWRTWYIITSVFGFAQSTAVLIQPQKEAGAIIDIFCFFLLNKTQLIDSQNRDCTIGELYIVSMKGEYVSFEILSNTYHRVDFSLF